MEKALKPERIETVIIGGGQAGLSVGYHMAKRDLPFVILDASERIGDAWRNRWDSLRLFSPARYDGLDGMKFPAPSHSFPTKDEMADYLEAYAERFDLPVRNGAKVDCLTREGDRFLVTANGKRFEADNVVVAMSSYRQPRAPLFAEDLDSDITQVHSYDYRNPSQLQDGDVLVVGAGNSGADIAVELSGTRRVWLSGRDVGQVPFRLESFKGRFLVPVVARGLFHRVLTIKTPMGRKMRPKVLAHSGPRVRVKSSDLARAGVECVPRTAGARDGKPLLEDGRVLDVANVVWCTGFRPDFPWIQLPIFGDHEPMHRRGIVESEPGLYFVGLHFLYSLSSEMIHGVGRDAEHIAKHVQSRMKSAVVA